MTPSPTIAVAHYPEGAGHATRMLAIADALEAAGATVRMAGGGAGTQFVALNGYDEFEPVTVDYIDTFQDGSMWRVATESVPATAGRVTDYVEWLRDLNPDALVTDDMFAAIAATRTDVPLYVLKHDMPGLYHDPIERAGASFHTRVQLSAARAFFYPTVWPESDVEPAGVTRVPPIALDGEGCERDAPDVVVVPSHYSELGPIAENLDRQGYDVLDVGSDEWSPVPSLLPYIRRADAVVCSGYSTVMDAAVAGDAGPQRESGGSGRRSGPTASDTATSRRRCSRGRGRRGDAVSGRDAPGRGSRPDREGSWFERRRASAPVRGSGSSTPRSGWPMRGRPGECARGTRRADDPPDCHRPRPIRDCGRCLPDCDGDSHA